MSTDHHEKTIGILRGLADVACHCIVLYCDAYPYIKEVSTFVIDLNRRNQYCHGVVCVTFIGAAFPRNAC